MGLRGNSVGLYQMSVGFSKGWSAKKRTHCRGGGENKKLNI